MESEEKNLIKKKKKKKTLIPRKNRFTLQKSNPNLGGITHEFSPANRPFTRSY